MGIVDHQRRQAAARLLRNAGAGRAISVRHDPVADSAPTFVEKAAIFPGATFIVGADTLARIAEPRYYGNDREACAKALEAIAAAGCRFLVFGRRTQKRFESLADLALPPVLRVVRRSAAGRVPCRCLVDRAAKSGSA